MKFLMDMETFKLNGERWVRCADCEERTVITHFVKTGESLSALQKGKEMGEGTWEPHQENWLCPDCANERRMNERLRDKPLVTVPEPPSEYRYCQACGEQISPTRLDGQFCESCADA